MRGIKILFIFAFAKELISYPFYPFTILIINIQKMENLSSVLWQADNALPPVFSLANYTMQPNPSNGYVQVLSSEAFNLGDLVQLIDMHGRVVSTQKVREAIGLVELELSNAPNGVYSVRLISEGVVVWQSRLVLIKD